MKQFDWHGARFTKTLNSIGQFAKQFTGTYKFEGWLDWFEAEHKEAHDKLTSIEDSMNNLWGKEDPPSMELFKKLLKQYEEGMKWAVNKYIDSLKAQARVGEQGVLV